MPYADIVLTGARTVSGECVDIALVGNAIVEVAPHGALRHGAGSGCQRHDVEGRLVTPGLWDSHLHLYQWCQMRHRLQLGHCRDREALLAEVSSAPPGDEPLLGHGLSCHGWHPEQLPNRQLLDAVTGDRPALLWCSDLHSGLANSAALARAELLQGTRQVESGVVERDASGSPTGWLRELAVNLVTAVLPLPHPDRLRQWLLQGQATLHSLGITGVCDQRIKDQHEGPELLALLRELEVGGQWKLRTNLNVAAHHLEQASALGVTTGFGSDRLRLGHIKLFADGTLGSRTARMLAPMRGAAGEDGRGIYLTSPEEMRSIVLRGAQAGWSLSVHAIGDEANRVCLDLFTELEERKLPRPRVPHRIEHAQILDDAEIARFAQLGVVASVQAGHLLEDRVNAESALAEQARRCYRFADLWRSGARLVFGTDAPVSEIDPRWGMGAAARRCCPGETPWGEEQCLPVEVIWEGYTHGAASAAGWGQLVGRLAPGYRADLAIWRDDPLSGGHVTHTFFDGELVYRRDEEY